MLAEPVALLDVNDTEAFVQATINRSRRVYAPDERDELVSEGLRIMLELRERYDPHRAGYECGGRFSGFAAKYLPLKLEDAYHRMHPEHVLRTDAQTGRRRHEYGERAVSLEALSADDPDRNDILSAPMKGLDPLTIKRRAHEALWARYSERVKLWSEMAEMLAEGATDADLAEIFGCTGEQVKEAKAALAPEMPYILGGEET